MLAGVSSPEHAIMAVAELELLRALHTRGRKAARFITLPGLLGYADSENRAIIALPYDVIWGDNARNDLIQGILQHAKQQKTKWLEAWISGYLTTGSRKLFQGYSFTPEPALLERLR